jgi:DNA-binding MarR family transcriptional regulator
MEVKNETKLLLYSLIKLRQWERENIPFCKTNGGYHLFLSLSIEVMSDEPRLKNIYYSLPYSEKTIRTLLKYLETDGWIELSNKPSDLRHKDIQVTPKFEVLFNKWMNEVKSIFKSVEE